MLAPDVFRTLKRQGALRPPPSCMLDIFALAHDDTSCAGPLVFNLR